MANNSTKVGNRNAATAPTAVATKPPRQSLLPFYLRLLMQVCIALVVASSCLALPSASAKNLDGHHLHAHHEQQHAHHRRRLQRDSSSKVASTHEQCHYAREYFESIDIKLNGNFEEKGKFQKVVKIRKSKMMLSAFPPS
ncbi:uncharacterized protein LOC128861338 isoform X1 [Anastrepha ludens]|uniref:uncharacterized protein LOC128861338 isoform X1 n=1 Tax=Anastrepha ludens TaxID=28586 RepID=UPI0023B16A4C|nr:uncharacterized protein LOC128861338 isoform X1 [Anastrepha ludens]XP_053955381.1 uncharacterized protein LOC128861338 isoform X1 [Anastrepha ludens]XP_053955382.1 uncharacterized protein LOC128861338 isoform X1 [Anastrepha ludens]XP_053955383.1 uncharacterized protein LOC128861338 isoform X1 [Anastrepha ludens]XP_053955384.1 uncharacterized protein LOC128861338 isoform X1 [Anastrepha ludens]XP_053955385.1 uncharacterized protein LOC128861338 isoform X1 [Anastrepha ludens]XP_053955386.1 un